MERTILVVEDSRTQAQHLASLLEGEAYRVDVASGAEGLERLTSSPPDLIICDLEGPGMDGFAFCRAAKSLEMTRRIPFVLVTGHASPEDVLRGLEHGADAFVSKPFEKEDLLERIRRTFEYLDHRRKGHLEIELGFRLGDRRFTVSADKAQIIELLFSHLEELMSLNARLEDSQRKLEEYARTLELRVHERTRELRGLFEGVPVGLLTFTPDGRITDANPAAAQMFDYPDPDALLAANSEDLYAEQEERLRLLRLMEAEGVVRAYECRFRRRDGATIWGRVNARVVRDAAGHVQAYEGAIEDTTERRRAEEEVRLLETLTLAVREAESLDEAFEVVLRKICQSLGFAFAEVWLPSSDQRHLDLSPAWYGARPALEGLRSRRRHVTLSRDEGLVGRAWASRLPASLQDLSKDPAFPEGAAVKAGLRAAMAIPVVTEASVVAIMVLCALESSEEEPRLLRLLSAAAGQLGPVVQRKRTEEALRQTEKLATMGELLAGVAHELNNPLSVLIGQSALLKEQATTDTLKQRATKIATAAERCARIVRNFLALARKRPTERQPVRVNQIVTDAVELLAYQLRVSTIEVQTDLASDLPLTLADPNQLHQIVVNLITNAQQAMRQSAPPNRITIQTRWDRGADRIELRAGDTGPGIPPDIQARIFEPFFTTKPVGEGTGLGLSLARGIIEDHGGRIRVESEVGHGATFVIELPVKPAEETAPEPYAAASTSATAGGAILIVDDEVDIASILAEMLVADGHEVDTVTDGRLALKRIRARKYDLIVSDLRMPNLDGPGLHRELLRRDPALAARMVFVTGDALSPEVRDFIEGCGAPTLGKPFGLDEVRRVVGSAMAAGAVP